VIVQDVTVQEPASPEAREAPAPVAPSPEASPSVRARAASALRTLRTIALVTIRSLFCVGFGIALVLGLVNGGLNLAPGLGASGLAAAVGSPRPPPVIPPMVPAGARRDWAMFSYVEKINQAWGKDWPFVIQLFEEFDARYPGEPMVKDKLYACYIEDGRTLQGQGDVAGARRRFEQAARYDPTRPEAGDFLAALDRRSAGR